MKKIQLDLDHLRVDTFVTTPDEAAASGTVHGHITAYWQTCFENSCGPRDCTEGSNYTQCTCDATCAATCANTCPNTCANTCANYTCANTCWNTCDDATCVCESFNPTCFDSCTCPQW